jgi:hypothetical protein
MDLDRLEQKLMELENQITTAKQAGETKKLDLLEKSIAISENEIHKNASDLLIIDEDQLESLDLLDVENSVMFDCPLIEPDQKESTLLQDFMKLKMHLTCNNQA